MFAALVGACAAVALVVTVASAYVYQRAFFADEHQQLAGECATLASMLDMSDADDDAATLSALVLDEIRATLISPTGEVLYDSQADASALPNHADRPEVADALSSGRGSSERSSETVGYVSLYDAVQLDSGDVLRLSVDRAGVAAFFSRDLFLLGLLCVAVVVIGWVVSRRLTASFMRPVLEIDPSAADAQAPYEELEPLVTRLNEQQAELMDRMSAIQDANDMRREFTSNVTHELKTPIASISGAAELIRDGICRPDDVQGFAARIYGDAQRMNSLVSDILTLGKLDDSERAGSRDVLFGPDERVDLSTIAHDVCERLSPRAKKRGVRLSVAGSSCAVMGNARLLDELVSNLVENAVRYNREGGHVWVRVRRESGCPVIEVQDDGIGIPEEAQSKVFERFYRVDKGRSRDMGGTGLGLAIVKHAAAYHGAEVVLVSAPGRGTTVTVTFPEG